MFDEYNTTRKFQTLEERVNWNKMVGDRDIAYHFKQEK